MEQFKLKDTRNSMGVFFIFLLCNFLNGQSIAIQVVGGAGSSHPQLESTLGELSISEFNHSGYTLSEGFHQGKLLISTSIIDIPGVDVKVYPNPFASELHVSYDYPQKITALILDVMGRQVIKTTLSQDEESLDLQALHPGSYFLILLDGNTQIHYSKLTKI